MSGFIGTNLSNYIKERGYDVLSISKSDILSGDKNILKEKISGSDVVINLAGAPISMSWSRSHIELMYKSRINTTALLIDAINSVYEEDRPKLFISTSAVGIYSSDEINTENSHIEKDYSVLNRIAMDWESECKKLDDSVRCVILRFATVLGSGGGVIKTYGEMLKFKTVVCTGSRSHPFPWIYIGDLIRIFGFVIDNQVWGVFNCVSPENMTLGKFCDEVKKEYRAWYEITIPDSLLKMLIGERSQIFIKQQRVVPANLLLYGFSFECTSLESALKRINI